MQCFCFNNTTAEIFTTKSTVQNRTMSHMLLCSLLASSFCTRRLSCWSHRCYLAVWGFWNIRFVGSNPTRWERVCLFADLITGRSPIQRVLRHIWNTRWFKYDRDKLWLVYTQIVPVIFEPPCIRRLIYFKNLKLKFWDLILCSWVSGSRGFEGTTILRNVEKPSLDNTALQNPWLHSCEKISCRIFLNYNWREGLIH
jgi:hypothetical protein